MNYICLVEGHLLHFESVLQLTRVVNACDLMGILQVNHRIFKWYVSKTFSGNITYGDTYLYFIYFNPNTQLQFLRECNLTFLSSVRSSVWKYILFKFIAQELFYLFMLEVVQVVPFISCA